jgi:uncharacterized protein YkvS
LLGLCTACKTNDELSEPAPTAIVTSIPVTYETTPGEIIHHLASGWKHEPYEGLEILVASTQEIEEYDGESGTTNKIWQAEIGLGNEWCLGGEFVHVGDVVEFSGYRIRIVEINQEKVVAAISGDLSTPSEINLTCIGIHNQLTSERSVTFDRQSQRHDSIEFYRVGDPLWIEEYVDQDGNLVEGPAFRLKARYITMQDDESVEYVVHMGDIIEFKGYRIRVMYITEPYVRLAMIKLSDLQPEN